MSFIRSIAILTGVCLCIAFAYFFGYGLATHSARPVIFGAVMLLAGAALLALLARRPARHPS